MCLLSSCCCGCQTLEQGLFIFGVFDILIRLVMTFLDSWTGNHTMGIAGILVLADIGLAAGAKLEVRLLILVWMFVFGFWIFISIVLPPALILIGWIFTEALERKVTGSGANYYTYVLNHITNINSISESKILYFSYHVISWLLGWFYLYIWLLARSLYTKISPLTTVHVLPGVYADEKEDEQTHISRF